MTFRPLFFLPDSWLRWAYEQAYAEKLMKHWIVRAIFCSVDGLGIWFPYNGDEVLWLWPWERQEREGDNRGKAPFISLGFTGTGEWGDAKYWTLQELDRHWDEYFEALSEKPPFVAGEWMTEGVMTVVEDGLTVLKPKDIEHESSSLVGVVLKQIDKSGQAEIELK